MEKLKNNESICLKKYLSNGEPLIAASWWTNEIVTGKATKNVSYTRINFIYNITKTNQRLKMEFIARVNILLYSNNN